MICTHGTAEVVVFFLLPDAKVYGVACRQCGGGQNKRRVPSGNIIERRQDEPRGLR